MQHINADYDILGIRNTIFFFCTMFKINQISYKIVKIIRNRKINMYIIEVPRKIFVFN